MAAVRYLVHDVGEAVEFYVRQLGFREEDRYGPAMAILEHDGLRLWLAGPTGARRESLRQAAGTVSSSRSMTSTIWCDGCRAAPRSSGIR